MLLAIPGDRETKMELAQLTVNDFWRDILIVSASIDGRRKLAHKFYRPVISRSSRSTLVIGL